MQMAHTDLCWHVRRTESLQRQGFRVVHGIKDPVYPRVQTVVKTIEPLCQIWQGKEDCVGWWMMVQQTTPATALKPPALWFINPKPMSMIQCAAYVHTVGGFGSAQGSGWVVWPWVYAVPNTEVVKLAYNEATFKYFYYLSWVKGYIKSNMICWWTSRITKHYFVFYMCK